MNPILCTSRTRTLPLQVPTTLLRLHNCSVGMIPQNDNTVVIRETRGRTVIVVVIRPTTVVRTGNGRGGNYLIILSCYFSFAYLCRDEDTLRSLTAWAAVITTYPSVVPLAGAMTTISHREKKPGRTTFFCSIFYR